MNTALDLPSYQDLFGELDFKTSDDARSVYSPAAYLADLLQLLDDRFEDPALEQRRDDIKEILLNADNTFTLVPYLDIVNEVLERKIGGDVYAKLTDKTYPFNLPFNLDHEGVKKCLTYLGITAEQLYRQFAPQPDPDIVARVYLGLSLEEYRLVTAPLDDFSSDEDKKQVEQKIKQHYQLDDGETWESLKVVERFLKATDLTGPQVRELLFQKLSTSALDDAKNPETTRAEPIPQQPIDANDQPE